MSTNTINDVEGLKEHISQLKFELSHYKSNNEELVSKLAKSERQLSKVNKYNEELREQIEQLSKEVHQYRKEKSDIATKLNSDQSTSVNSIDVAIQVKEDDFEMVFESKALPSWNSDEKKEPSVDTSSIADAIKATAEAVLQNQTGSHPQADSTTNPSNQQDAYSNYADTSTSQYYYDENSQMYYDYHSGYYIDTKNNLYYDPNSGTYFYYNKETETYEFHSQIDLKNTSCEKQSEISRSSSGKKRGRHKLREMDRKSHSKRKKSRTRKTTPTIKKKKKKKKSHKHKKKLEKFAEDRSYHKKKAKRLLASCSEEFEKSNKGSSSSVKNNVDIENDDCVVRLNDKTDEFRNESMDVDGDITKESRFQEDLSSIENNVKDEENDTESDVDSDSVCTDESELESGELSCDNSTDTKSDCDVIFDEECHKNEKPEDSNPEILSQFVPYTGDEKYLVSSEAAASWPPCIRAIVKESDCLDAGDLSIITCTGGSIGRDKGKNHLIIINDINTSRNHCSVWFDYDKNQYMILDEGSQHGTYLNNQRLSKPNEGNEETGIQHGDELRISSTVFLLHIHPGNDTCDECEPGEVKAKIEKETEIKNDIVIMSAEEKKKQRKAELNSIKKRYGLKNMAFVDNVEALNNPEYKDRATVRRKNVGSDCPAQKAEAPASVHRPVSEKNKGHKMLSKLGWKEGEGLGKTSDGIIEPITVNFRKNQSAGLGSNRNVFESIDNVDEKSAKKTNMWLQAQERYDKIENSNTVGTSDSPECRERPEAKTKVTWVKAEHVDTDNT